MANPLTRDVVVASCVKHGFYKTPSCNDKLYLHHKGVDAIAPQALLDYTDARVIWLEGNCLAQIGANDFASQWPVLRQLYLHNNMLRSTDWIGRFQRLGSLNLSDNYIERLSFGVAGKEFDGSASGGGGEGSGGASPAKSEVRADEPTARPLSSAAFDALLDQFEAQCRSLDDTVAAERTSSCPAEGEAGVSPMPPSGVDNTLTMLQLKNNQLKSPLHIVELLALRQLTTLDLSGNKLEDGERVLRILERLPNLLSLYLSGNPCVRGIPNYRRTVIAQCKKLKHLDDRPVFDDERRLVTAWAEGGVEGEKKEKKLMREEEDAVHRQRLEDFRKLVREGQRELARQQQRGHVKCCNRDSDEADGLDRSATDTDNASSEASSSDSSDTDSCAPHRHSEFFNRNYQGKPPARGALPMDSPPTASAAAIAETADAAAQAHRDAPAYPAPTSGTGPQPRHVDPCCHEDNAAAATTPEAASPPAASAGAASVKGGGGASKSTKNAGPHSALWEMAAAIPDGHAGGGGQQQGEEEEEGVWVPGE